ncbi:MULTISPECIES: CD1375 family protein [Listeria]|nr:MULTISPECIES: CD1375 family protein [Listeria]
MAVIYLNLILNGKKTFKEVPRLLQTQVKALLIDADCAELAE